MKPELQHSMIVSSCRPVKPGGHFGDDYRVDLKAQETKNLREGGSFTLAFRQGRVSSGCGIKMYRAK